MITIDENRCNACGECVSICEVRDINILNEKAHPLGVDCTECGHCVAVCPQNAIILLGYNQNEIIEYKPGDFDVDPLIFSNFMKFRRSTRKFKARKVETDKINAILEAGRYSPTACNNQNLSYVVIDKEMDIVRDMLWEGANIYATKNKDRYLLSRYHEYIESGKSSDCLLYGCSQIIFVLSSDENDACIASSRMELMAHSLGLGALFLGYGKLAVEASPILQNYLGENEKSKTQVVLALGYADIKWQRTVPRKDIKVSWK